MSTTKAWLNKVYLTWFILNILVILFVDAVPLYPASLYQPAGSPLHFLQRIRDAYLARYDDLIVGWEPATSDPARSWIRLLTLMELVFALPTVVYGAFRLAIAPGATSGPDELLFLVYGFQVALTTAVCLHDIAWWDEKAYPWSVKNVYLFQVYGPWLVVPALMFVDMYQRILGRMRVAAAHGTEKKLQ